METSKKLSVLTLVFSLILLFLMPNILLAETNSLNAQTFNVYVKPEYDDPQTLVINKGDFVNSGDQIIKKGTPISFIIPEDASIGMACELNAQGGHECQPYTITPLGNNKVQLSWKITKDIAPNQKYPIFFEFYYDNKAVAPNKVFDYTFIPTSSIEILNLSLTAPKAATNFMIDPASSTVSKDKNGLSNYLYTYNNLTPDTPVDVNVSYVKSDNKPTFDKPQVGKSNPPSSSGTGENWLMKPAVIIPLILAIVLIVFLVTYALRKPQGKLNSNNSSSSKSTKSKKGSVSANTKFNQEKKRIRQMLLDGEISEDTYKQLIKDLEEK